MARATLLLIAIGVFVACDRNLRTEAGVTTVDDPVPTLVQRHQIAENARPVVARPFFYQVEKVGKVSYVLGTRHASVGLAVSVVDASSKVVVRTIPVGKGPVGARPSVDGMMYVDAEEAKTVAVIDPATLAVTRTIDLGFTPVLGTPPGGGEVWVTDADDGKLVFYTASGANTGEVLTGAGAQGIAFSSDGTTAYVTNQFANTVSVVAVPAHAVTATVVVGTKPNGRVFRAR